MGFYLKKHMNLMFYGNSVCFLVFTLLCLTLPKDRKTLKAQAQERRAPAADQTVKRAGKGPTFQSKEIYLILLYALAMQLGIN